MRLLESSVIKLEWADINSRANHPAHIEHRSPGTHLSGVLRHIAIASGILKNVDSTSGKWIGDGDIDEDEMPLRMAVGMAWEQWAAGLFHLMHWQPGEMECEKIFGTPDGISEFNVPGITFEHEYCILLEEFKATWKSSRTMPITSQWMWMHQVMGYLKMLQANGYPETCHVRMHVLWVNGDYERPYKPCYMTYLIEFSQSEIDTCWALIMRHKNDERVKQEPGWQPDKSEAKHKKSRANK